MTAAGQSGTAPHWQPGGRAALAELLARDWDLLVIGGGITGAGILLEASRRGLNALLVEQNDFAWGTSSRSSKLVHGGLRYLKEGKFALTRESVHERESLLRDAAGLVEPQSFAFGDYKGRKPGRRTFLAGLAIYDHLAGQRGRHYYPREEFLAMAPNIGSEGLRGGMCYLDAKTDDSRLVMRVLQEAQALGGTAFNYLSAQALLRSSAAGRGSELAAASGRVCGALLRDGIGGTEHEVRARVVISATGAWADALRAQGGGAVGGCVAGGGTGAGVAAGAGRRLRPLRGSHLVLPAWRLPLAQAVSLMHPADGRPVFAFPWEGVTLVGTTDVDHREDMRFEAAITRDEVDYLMAALRSQFPRLGLQQADIIATYAGVRPVIDSGQADPSKETREHALWLEDGLLTVTGGKLTTFRVIALDALRQAAAMLPGWQADFSPQPIFPPSAAASNPRRHSYSHSHRHRLPAGQALRLQGRYGVQAEALLACARGGEPDELALIPGTASIWAQLRWAARHESVQHLEDLLLRRLRIGLQLRGGGVEILPRVRAICQQELAWNDARWDAEQASYLALWKTHYSLPA
ncbi:FAD-dependent oxidoreductase [Massilia sp. Root418]|uniref:glycerol-3-phosphate dehydrogenase/oxidase n=1 Tax=Massilia sp. Root418 TaxID=1736532 RepID=UPI0006F75839|nr:glycerol-3-phosphate dehydrogenase/oxidase [Massilia sp. Root418]KQW93810.1 FAD-dependent oxidoreductase [Massilia sp. Root418]